MNYLIISTPYQICQDFFREKHRNSNWLDFGNYLKKPPDTINQRSSANENQS